MMIFSISVIIPLLGSGRAVARWVNFESRQVFVTLTLAVVVNLMVDHWKISSLTALIALSQFMSRCFISPVSVNPVVGVICRLSGALPNMAYLVFETFVVRPESALNLLSMSRMWVSCCVGWVYVRKR